MSQPSNALAELVEIQCNLLIPGIGCIDEILDDLSKTHPVTSEDRAEIIRLADAIAKDATKLMMRMKIITGFSLADAFRAFKQHDDGAHDAEAKL